MWSRLLPWIDAIPEALGPVERARVRVQHLIVLLMQVIGLPYAVTFVLLGMLTSGLVNGIVFLGSIVALLGLTRRGYHRLGGMVISVGFFFTITTALVARGGMTSGRGDRTRCRAPRRHTHPTRAASPSGRARRAAR